MTQISSQQTLQQRRAAHAHAKVTGIERAAFAKEYGSEVRRLPAMIQTDGLGAALAFLLAKGKDQHKEVYHHIEEWLRQPEQFGFTGDLLEWVLKQPTPVYRQIASETLAYVGWLKRFAEAKDLKAPQ